MYLAPLYPFSHFMSYDILSSSYRNFLTSLNTIVILKTLSKALNSKSGNKLWGLGWKHLKIMGLGM